MKNQSKRALVTGGSRGLGLAICRRLLEENWHVITISRQKTSGLMNLGKKYSLLQHCSIDLGDPAQLRRFSQDDEVFNRLDGFVANAAVGTEGLLSLTSETAICECVQTNLTSLILLTRQVVKAMLTRGGSLVFISSVAAAVGLAGLSVYSATKGGLISFSRSIAREYGARGIRANCVLPGFLETEMTERLSADDRARLKRRAALKRFAEVDDVASAVVYLLSDEARSVTGTELVVDAGFSV